MAVVTGTNGNDTLNGTNNNDTVKGLNGDDALFGLDGDDILDGGSGNDVLDGGNNDDLLLGGIGLDLLVGGAGNNRLDGGRGADNMQAGVGDDTYVVDDANDQITDAGGTDLVETTVSYVLGANIENATVTGKSGSGITGNGLNNILTGNNAGNKLFGLGGDDTLDGGFGGDSLTGGLGDDNYIVDNKMDKVFELAGEGHDTVTAFVNYTLSADVDVLILGEGTLGAVPPTAGTGNAGDNTIIGNTTSNTLDGGGGLDTLIGGDGNDVYIVNNGGVTVTENAAEGNDTVRASINYVLGANLDNLLLTGTGNINGGGNGENNIITGNSGANILNGFIGNDTLDGGAGADVMAGGTGDDTFVVDSLADIVTELGGEGTADTVMSSITYSLVALPEIERLTLIGTAAINGTGNDADNVITGNTGANILTGGIGADTIDGGGGSGMDTLLGGVGDDLYIINSATGKTIIENPGEGTDTVQASVSYTLGAELDNLLLAGTANINGTGNGLVNTITGNTGNNTLDGAGGADLLIGGGGNDAFVVDNAGDVVDGTGLGTNTVFSSINWDLAVNTTNVTNLTLIGLNPSTGTGDGNDNTITGNTAFNFLFGLGGDDVLVVDPFDIIDGGIGSDTAAVNFSVGILNPSWTSIENITLLGRAAINATGDGGNNTLTGNAGRNTLDGGLGDDTFIITRGDVVIDAGGNDTVEGALTYKMPSFIENFTLLGTGKNNITGNALSNVIIANDSINTLDGGTGADLMIGGLGGDTYIVDNPFDIVFENFSPFIETDTVRASVSYALGAFLNDLVLTGLGDINGFGNNQENHITGNNGNNSIDGGTGIDTLEGAGGNDTYFVDSSSDVVTDKSGIDGIFATDTSYALTEGDGVESLTFLSTVPLTAFTGTGNELANTITGNDGADTLDGLAGGDTLIGGTGDDVYTVDSTRDVVIENFNEGHDIINTTVNYTLPQDVDVLILVSPDGILGLHGAGNGGDNTVDGSVGDDIIMGMAGNDTLIGEEGSDTVTGGAGDDVLIGDAVSGEGSVDTYFGNEGADTFFLTSAGVFLTDNHLDLIRDYSLAEGDKIDLTDVLQGVFSAAVDNIDDFVNVTANGTLQLDLDGTGGTTSHWVSVATLTGVHGVAGQHVVDFIVPP